MEPTIYKPSIYKGTGIYKTGAGGGGGGGDIPFTGDKKYNWDFSEDNQNYLIDTINGKVASQPYHNGFVDGYLNVGYQYGVKLGLTILTKLYIECTFIIKYDLSQSSKHTRLINQGGTDDSSLLLWRAYGSNYWTTYYSSWGSNVISTDKNLVNDKKLGIYIKDNNKYDLYLDNELKSPDIPLSISSTPLYIGCGTPLYTENGVIICKGVTIYENCEPK